MTIREQTELIEKQKYQLPCLTIYDNGDSRLFSIGNDDIVVGKQFYESSFDSTSQSMYHYGERMNENQSVKRNRLNAKSNSMSKLRNLMNKRKILNVQRIQVIQFQETEFKKQQYEEAVLEHLEKENVILKQLTEEMKMKQIKKMTMTDTEILLRVRYSSILFFAS